MFNLQPGQGLGFTGSKEIAFGLGFTEEAPPVVEWARGYNIEQNDKSKDKRMW